MGSTEQSVVQHEIDPSCDTSCPSGVCNNGGTGPQIADAISFLGGSGDYGYTNSALSQSDLDNALQAGPIAVLYDCGSYGGHGVLIDGGSGGSYSGYDPEGYGISAQYSDVTTYRPSYIGATCQWFGTTYIGDFNTRSEPAVAIAEERRF